MQSQLFQTQLLLRPLQDLQKSSKIVLSDARNRDSSKRVKRLMCPLETVLLQVGEGPLDVCSRKVDLVCGESGLQTLRGSDG
jgi:hypothetical protein